jgi:dihydropteroate synthase
MQKFNIANQIFDFKRPYLVGIVNITPDSFSDGGSYLEPTKALEQIELLITQGADIIELGAESTRPNAQQISAEDEIARLSPILKAYKKHFATPLALDTVKYPVANFGLDFGVDIINDISALRITPQLANLAAKYHATLVLMHMQGTPQTMQAAPIYQDVVSEVKTELHTAINTAKQAGVTQIIIDPGIGFGKTLEHNLQLLKNLAQFKSLNVPIFIGTSRKTFLGKITGTELPKDRLAETISSNLSAVKNGANFLRIHDVLEMKKALDVWLAIEKES